MHLVQTCIVHECLLELTDSKFAGGPVMIMKVRNLKSLPDLHELLGHL